LTRSAKEGRSTTSKEDSKGASASRARRLADEAAQAPGPAVQQNIRRQNLAFVLREVMENGLRSRAGLAEAVGLTRATVSSLVGELIDRGFLVERELESTGNVGRPGRLVAVSGATVAALGLEISADYLAASVLDLAGDIRYEEFVRHDNRSASAEQVLDRLADLAFKALESVEREGLRAVGTTLAIPGLVDYASGMLLKAPELGWEETSIEYELARRLKRPHQYLSVENDANLAALGELWLGKGQSWGDFLRVSGEIGVGGALVVKGELLRSGSGLGGQLGHVTVDQDGPRCACGSYGCLEQYAGQEALLREAGLEGRVGTSIALPDGGVSLLVRSARRGDPGVLAALTQAGRALGLALSASVNLFAPSTVVLGGIYAPLFPWLSGPLGVELEERAYLTRYSRIAIVPSELGPRAAVRGAASLALRAVCADPVLVGVD
jgi:predicted NBD/HSP70 family sugar kinase